MQSYRIIACPVILNLPAVADFNSKFMTGIALKTLFGTV